MIRYQKRPSPSRPLVDSQMDYGVGSYRHHPVAVQLLKSLFSIIIEVDSRNKMEWHDLPCLKIDIISYMI